MKRRIVPFRHMSGLHTDAGGTYACAMAEFDWIARYFSPLAKSEGAAGLRDDVARITHSGGVLVATMDALVEGVHFLPADPIETIARKLVRVNVSDLIAKGARPSEALLTLGWPDGRSEAELAVFAGALGAELSEWGAGLVGGDTVSHPGGLFLSMTMTGRCGTDGPVRRSGAQTGDDVWVTGFIGSGGLGLEAAQGRISDEAMLGIYRVPAIPSLGISDLIATLATASIDVSDGLLADALHLAAASGVQMEIGLEVVPLAQKRTATGAVLQLCTSGDDYQALFTAAEANREKVRETALSAGASLACIGKISPGTGLKLTHNGRAVNLPETLGFQHD